MDALVGKTGRLVDWFGGRTTGKNTTWNTGVSKMNLHFGEQMLINFGTCFSTNSHSTNDKGTKIMCQSFLEFDHSNLIHDMFFFSRGSARTRSLAGDRWRVLWANKESLVGTWPTAEFCCEWQSSFWNEWRYEGSIFSFFNWMWFNFFGRMHTWSRQKTGGLITWRKLTTTRWMMKSKMRLFCMAGEWPLLTIHFHARFLGHSNNLSEDSTSKITYSLKILIMFIFRGCGGYIYHIELTAPSSFTRLQNLNKTKLCSSSAHLTHVVVCACSVKRDFLNFMHVIW